ncbi:hypothetical protein R1flu_029170 [Riccia fluitans]|uniref:Reverse transcriptase domain-containing protein n=1 Tax=Riccia fluitans TaxID=41844 RepID=A0ABD1XNR6_9MARC
MLFKATSITPGANDTARARTTVTHPQQIATSVPPPSYANIVAAGTARNRRNLDTRGRNQETWKAARERKVRYFTAISKTDECAARNRERFQRQQVTGPNPYPELENDVEPTEARRQGIKDTFQFLRDANPNPEGKKTVRVEINAQQLMNRGEFLKAKSFILCTVDISSSREAVAVWAKTILHQEMGIQVDRKLRWKQRTGVIKLIPKEGDRQKLKNWRPLPLLNTGYQVISNLIANGLREVIGKVMDTQQKGFIKGKNIADNILNFLICSEWARKSETPCIFVKLDFEKAYDRVNHTYLWETMAAMGFAEDFVTLWKGLVEDSPSKIHGNGLFSKEIKNERGVKQGCPLAPLLFAISTQPLMTLLKNKEAEHKIQGLQLQGPKHTLHNLFADDSGIMLQATEDIFNELKDSIATYEIISGAKLNISKSTIIPVAMESTPSWLHRTGCYVASEGEIIRYLGVPIGWNVTEA